MSDPLDLLQTLPGAVLITQDGAIQYANAAAVALLEVESAECLIGRQSGEFVHLVDQIRSTQRIQQVADPDQEGRPNKSSEFRICTAKGHLRMVLISSVALEWHGKPAVLMCGLDMTHQSEIQAQLRESEQNFRRLFENMQDVYYRTDANGVVQHVGPGGHPIRRRSRRRKALQSRHLRIAVSRRAQPGLARPSLAGVQG